MPLLDRAAQALVNVQGRGPWDTLPAEARERLRMEVRAILDALRDPDETMAEAGAEIIRNVGPDETGTAHLNDAVNTWRYMIDALRGER